MERLREAAIADEDRLRALVREETGKTFEATAEDFGSLVASLRYYADEMARVAPEPLPDAAGEHAHVLVREPLGVAAAFIAWNFPLLNLAFKLGPAMAAGCPLVVKPSLKTPLAALRVGELCHEIGLPAGVVNIVTGDDAAIGDRLSASPVPALLTLIGSTATGRHVVRTGATTIKRHSMELGGNAPVIVREDADLDLAADTIAALKFGNAGQTCVSPNPILAQVSVHDALRDRLIERARDVRVGFGPEGSVGMGPLIDEDAASRVRALVAEAAASGATLHVGGGVPEGAATPAFVEPTVLSGITDTMAVWREDVFGPVVSMSAYGTDEEAVARANDTEAGLTAYVFTRDGRRADALAARLRFGEVQVNGVRYAIDLPHGGFRQSGVGHDCSPLALDDYLAVKRVTRRVGTLDDAQDVAA